MNQNTGLRDGTVLRVTVRAHFGTYAKSLLATPAFLDSGASPHGRVQTLRFILLISDTCDWVHSITRAFSREKPLLCSRFFFYSADLN